MAHLIELYIFLADRCNFKCLHCITHSEPTAASYVISLEEIDNLAKFVNSTLSVKKVHFIGGEPSLQVPAIRSLQQKIGRNVTYVMTTNGWFVNNPNKVLDQIRLDEIQISADIFHSEFKNSDLIKPLLLHCVNLGIRTSLKLTARSQEDILTFQNLLIPGVELIVNKLEFSGKARIFKSDVNQSKEQSWDFTCPSLRNTEVDPEAIVYMPGKGLTPCCSGLLFDRLAPDKFLFSNLEDDFFSNNLLRRLFPNSFREIANEVKLDTSSFKPLSVCKACEFLMGDLKYAGLPSKYELAKRSLQQVQNYSLSVPLRREDMMAFDTSFRTTYLYVGEVLTGKQTSLPEGITLIEADKLSTEDLVAFSSKIMSQSQAKMSEREIIITGEQMRDFLSYCSHKFLYTVNGELVAGLYVHEALNHPVLEETVSHIGFLGIDNVLKSKVQREAIKDDFEYKLAKLSAGKKVSGRISAQNEPAIKFAEKMGRKLVSLAISVKPT